METGNYRLLQTGVSEAAALSSVTSAAVGFPDERASAHQTTGTKKMEMHATIKPTWKDLVSALFYSGTANAIGEGATQQGTDDQSDSKHALGMTVKAKTMITVPLKRPDAPKPAMAPPKLRATELGAAPQRIRPQR
ncbi:hypothetical protein A1F94_007914 [Pyrenophora tritici-repentis]|nr:hypothetical protein A1F94_007914 [Pyrenophora tritici-repentis]